MIGECLTARAADGFDPADWWGATDGEILDCLRERGTLSLDELCEKLGLTEGTATAFVAMLAREGRLRICQIELAA
ncbi:MAG TPA: winged helix-turn-helix domain-containing protein [Candidatus Bathyarchaeia archaeon]|nr:winged helix-turn-helix domain-containing protein [Candidatus Bathyarchaeia archaeon]